MRAVKGLRCDRAAADEHARGYREAYRPYCWPLDSIDDYALAPFHVLASDGRVHTDRDHVWHMETLAELCRHDEGIFRSTAHRVVDVTDPADVEAGIAWWRRLVEAGGEGMVVKPLEWIHKERRGLASSLLPCIDRLARPPEPESRRAARRPIQTAPYVTLAAATESTHTAGMDPLTIGFEDAFYEANGDEAHDADAGAALVAALRAVVDASPHRARPVTISAPSDGTIEVRRGDERLVLTRLADGWRVRGSLEPSRSGTLAEALTRWLTR